MYNTLRDVLQTMVVMEQFEIPGKQARHASIPEFLFNSPIGSYLSRQFDGRKNPLWSHQAQALNILAQGDNLVLSHRHGFGEKFGLSLFGVS